jgi:hypothetical protein
MAHFGVDHLRSRICSGAPGFVLVFEEEMSSLAGLPSRKCLAMNIPSMPDVYDLAYRFAAALGIGLLIGAERERRKGEGPSRSPAGIRTFMIASLSGAVSLALGGVPLLAITFLGVAGLCAVGYMRTEEQDPGLTTETALLLTVLLGGFALKEPVTASALAVTVAIALMARTRIHHFIRAVLSEEELTDALIFAAAALVVLPLVPDRYVGPFSAINPRTIWKIVILIMSISAGGHIAVRLLGPRFGLPLAGLASGFVSSVATIASARIQLLQCFVNYYRIAKAGPSASASSHRAGSMCSPLLLTRIDKVNFQCDSLNVAFLARGTRPITLRASSLPPCFALEP